MFILIQLILLLCTIITIRVLPVGKKEPEAVQASAKGTKSIKGSGIQPIASLHKVSYAICVFFAEDFRAKNMANQSKLELSLLEVEQHNSLLHINLWN